MPKKYTVENLIPALRIFVKARQEALNNNFTDNGGAIHSIQRIVDILSMSIVYPHLSHVNNLKTDPNAPRSLAADQARRKGRTVKIEHVAPQREYSQKICKLIEGKNCTDKQIIKFIKKHYELVLLTEQETKHLNKMNRSKMSPTRLEDAGIDVLDRKKQK